MKFICPLIVVKDIAKARYFYEEILGQIVKYDFGQNIQFEGDFSIHEKDHYSDLISIQSKRTVRFKSHNFELYFECEDLISVEQLLKAEGIEFVHGLTEQPWGQRVLRIYDFDGHIVEVGESMDSVILRYNQLEMSVEDIASKTSMPKAYVEKVVSISNY